MDVYSNENLLLSCEGCKIKYFSVNLGSVEIAHLENWKYSLWTCESFASVKFDLWPLLQGQGGLSTKKRTYFPYYWS